MPQFSLVVVLIMSMASSSEPDLTTSEELSHCGDDLDGDAISQPCSSDSKKRSREVDLLPDGPSNLSQCLSYNSSQLRHLLDVVPRLGQDTAKQLKQTAQVPIVVTSCYSGTGCFEGVAKQVTKCLAAAFPNHGGSCASYSATEISAVARSCLLSRSSAQHVFQDVLGRLPNAVREELQAVEKNVLDEYKYLNQELTLGQLDKGSFVAARNKLETNYLNTLREELSAVEFNDKDFCVVHNRMCHISPRHSKDFKNAYWIEASGNTCCPWSGMSTGNGWLDKATLPFFTWAYSTRYYEPDTILQENVPRFPESMIMEIVGNFSPGVIKDMCTRPLLKDELRSYRMEVQVFSPVDLGIPSQRRRKYTALHLSPWVKFGSQLSFVDMFYRKLQCDASIYLAAVPSHLRVLPEDSLAALGRGNAQRLESWKCWADKHGWRTSEGKWADPTIRFAFADLTQNARYRKKVETEFAPCFLTHTHLWDMVADRSVPVLVHWLAQGFPHPGASGIPPDLSQDMPLGSQLLDSGSPELLSDVAQRKLTGNAMHWNSIGSWLLYALSCTDKSLIVAGLRKVAAERPQGPSVLGNTVQPRDSTPRPKRGRYVLRL